MLKDGLFKYFNTMYQKITKDVDKAVREEDTDNRLKNAYLRGDNMVISLFYKGNTKNDLRTEVYLNMWIENVTPCSIHVLISIKRPDKGKYIIDVFNKIIMFNDFNIKYIAKQIVENVID